MAGGGWPDAGGLHTARRGRRPSWSRSSRQTCRRRTRRRRSRIVGGGVRSSRCRRTNAAEEEVAVVRRCGKERRMNSPSYLPELSSPAVVPVLLAMMPCAAMSAIPNLRCRDVASLALRLFCRPPLASALITSNRALPQVAICSGNLTTCSGLPPRHAAFEAHFALPLGANLRRPGGPVVLVRPRYEGRPPRNACTHRRP